MTCDTVVTDDTEEGLGGSDTRTRLRGDIDFMTDNVTDDG